MNPHSLLYVLLFVFGLTLPTVAASATVGDFIPEFVLETESGQTTHSQDLKGKTLFINFWASWCAPCRKELPLLSDLQEQHQDLVVVAINIDEKRENAIRFLKDYPFSGTVLFDQAGDVVDKFKAMAMPSSYIVDGSGKIRFVHYGFRQKKDPHQWAEEIRQLLKEV